MSPLYEQYEKVYEREEKRLYLLEKEIMPFKDWLEEIKARSIIGTQIECLKTIEKYAKIVINFIQTKIPRTIREKKGS